ncbi:hypothetical protein ACLB2K_038080 [Fragaria x ananassa]
MSTASGGGFVDVPELLSEAVTKQLPAVNEVAIAAADSYFPVKGLQYLIDYVHTTAGLNCFCICFKWTAIVLTTLLIRSCTVPLLVNQLKATAKLTIQSDKPEIYNGKPIVPPLCVDKSVVVKITHETLDGGGDACIKGGDKGISGNDGGISGVDGSDGGSEVEGLLMVLVGLGPILLGFPLGP